MRDCGPHPRLCEGLQSRETPEASRAGTMARGGLGRAGLQFSALLGFTLGMLRASRTWCPGTEPLACASLATAGELASWGVPSRFKGKPFPISPSLPSYNAVRMLPSGTLSPPHGDHSRAAPLLLLRCAPHVPPAVHRQPAGTCCAPGLPSRGSCCHPPSPTGDSTAALLTREPEKGRGFWGWGPAPGCCTAPSWRAR